jgi:hypothetical protein
VICFSYLISVSLTINFYCLPDSLIGYITSILGILILVGSLIILIKFGGDHKMFSDLTLKMNENKTKYLI